MAVEKTMADRVFAYLANHPDGRRLVELDRNSEWLASRWQGCSEA